MNKIQKIGVISLLLAIASIGFITADSEYNVVISPENPTVDNGYNVVISPENPTVFNAINVTAQLGFENANESATINIVDPYGNSTIINAATNENGEFIISFIPEYVGNYNITTTVGNWSQTQEITVSDRPNISLNLINFADPVKGDNINVVAEANDTVYPGDYVNFTVTDPNGIVSSQSVTFDGNVASFDISNATTGNYSVSAVAYDSDDEPISDVANKIIYVADTPQRSYDLTLSYAPESPLNGDDVIVTAKANDTVNPGDHVF
ncbi:MAG: hypothetical protein LBT66_02690, partial [Methanobrevibacter sp.]|nr:hypothetical protein [Candidatus Methanovirga meridionalis]